MRTHRRCKLLGRGKMLGPAAQVSVRRQKAANKSKARAARKNSAQSSLFSMGFRPSQLDQAERIAAHAEALRKEASVNAAAQQAHLPADGQLQTMKLFKGRLTARAPPKPKQEKRGRPRDPRGLDIPHSKVDLCRRVDYDMDGEKRTGCKVFGCSCDQFSRLLKHSACSCGHSSEDHEVFPHFGPALEDVLYNVGKSGESS